jgi:hypothetical protein
MSDATTVGLVGRPSGLDDVPEDRQPAAGTHRLFDERVDLSADLCPSGVK